MRLRSTVCRTLRGTRLKRTVLGSTNSAESTKRRCRPCPREVGASPHVQGQTARGATSPSNKVPVASPPKQQSSMIGKVEVYSKSHLRAQRQRHHPSSIAESLRPGPKRAALGSTNSAVSTKRRCRPRPREVGVSPHLRGQPTRGAASPFNNSPVMSPPKQQCWMTGKARRPFEE